jgi:hypothetical protein
MIPQTVAVQMLRRIRYRTDGMWIMAFLLGSSLAGISAGIIPWLTGLLGFGIPLTLCFGWNSSAERQGLRRFCSRHTGAQTQLAMAETLIPAGTGALAASLAALAGETIPWQFWLVLPLTSIIAAALMLFLQSVLPGGATALLGLYWLWSFIGLAGEAVGITVLLVPVYPAMVMAQKSGAPHSDGFVALSAALAGGMMYLLLRRNLKSTF